MLLELLDGIFELELFVFLLLPRLFHSLEALFISGQFHFRHVELLLKIVDLVAFLPVHVERPG